MKIIKPFKDSKQIWLGNEEGQIRKVYHCLGKEISESVHFNVGITVYDPGEGSEIVQHTESEKVVYIISGGCVLFDENNSEVFRAKKGDILFFEKGEQHKFFNDDEEQLKLIWFMTSQEHTIV